MSLDQLKKHAKNAGPLLEELGVRGPVKLSTSQKFVARLHGYPDWISACEAQAEAKKTRPPTNEPDPAAAYWVLRYETFSIDVAGRREQPAKAAVHIIPGVTNALGLLWFTASRFMDEQESPGSLEQFTLALEDCAEVDSATRQCLHLVMPGMRQRMSLRLYPLAERVLLLGLPDLSPEKEVVEILDTRVSIDDMETVLKAARLSYEDFKAEFKLFHEAHPAKSIFTGLQQFVADQAREDAASQGPRGGLWTAEEKHVGPWRFRLLFCHDSFYFDAFDEAGGTGTFTDLTQDSMIRRQASGQWVVGAGGPNQGTVRLGGLPHDAVESLAEVATNWGVGLTVEGVRRCSPIENGQAPSHIKFLTWLKNEHPDALKGGRDG
ncbi:hypothetical protein A9R05_42255 (plasmid) [Burkholderia sp. KK1]|uniref:Uncharacterized protein n=1 Tax=Burkholderia sp. M701 TaxID=326454 RepID=V5YNC4_9BURK|nr:hypothetical protein [Burkholderia sp. M701]AQH05643.1 hypothetical protein A9R05_42255 [Burkholderia sp. KK1]BAO18902.1 hypothetical protein [Burkholderia sp. M701]